MKHRKILFDADSLKEGVFEETVPGYDEGANKFSFICGYCGNEWMQTYIEGVTDI